MSETLLIVDDDVASREGFADVAKVAQYAPILATAFMARPQDLVALAQKQKVDAVLCDHKLREAGLAAFEGAEGVAALYSAGIPALLVTAYEPADVDISIRPLRRRIPCLMHKRPKAKELRAAIEYVRAETTNKLLPKERQPYRVSLFVKEVLKTGGRVQLIVSIPQALVKKNIALLLDYVPADARREAQAGGWFLADVNVNAICEEDLYIDNVRLPPVKALAEFHAKAHGH